MSDYGPSTPNVTPSTPEGGYGAPQKSGGAGKVILIILIIVGVVVIAPIVLFAFLFSSIWKTATSFMDGNNMIKCSTSDGSFSIYYDGNDVLGTTTENRASELEIDELKHGIESSRDVEKFLRDYSKKYEGLHSGAKCEISTPKFQVKINGGDDEDDVDVDIDDIDDDDDDDTSSVPFGSDTITASRKTVGNASYGYVDVPSEWIEFRDIDGNDSVQYSDVSGTYIMSLNEVTGTSLSAEQLAKNYAASKTNDPNVRGVTGATVKVGKKNYTAYQVYMYYPSDATYLVTYWFEGDNGKIHYISIEGGDKLAEYTWIAESYRETD